MATPGEVRAERRTLTVFAVSQFLLEVQFWLPLWLIFLLDQGVPLALAMLADAVFRMVVVAAEVPMGLLADRLGRRRTYLLSAAMSVVTFTLVAAVHSTSTMLLAWVVWGVAWALNSGTSAAYLYELTLAQGTDALRTFSFIRATGQFAILVSLLSAGALYQLNPRLPFAMTALLAALAFAAIWLLPEVQHPSRAPLRRVAPALWEPSTRTAILVAVLVLGYGWSLQILYQPIALELDLDAVATSVMYAGLALAGLLGAVVVARSRQAHRTTVLGIALCLVGVAGCTVALSWAPYVWLPLCSFGFVLAWTSVEVDLARIASRSIRATVYSVVSMLAGVGIAVARPTLGIAAGEYGASTTLIGWSLLGICVLFALLRLTRHKT